MNNFGHLIVAMFLLNPVDRMNEKEKNIKINAKHK